MNDALSLYNAHAAASEAARLFDEGVHHEAVRFQHVQLFQWIEGLHERVCLGCVLNLPDFMGRAQHPLAVQDGGDLFEREGIVLDGQRGVDGANLVLPLQLYRDVIPVGHLHATNQLAYLSQQGNDGGGLLKRWCVGSHNQQRGAVFSIPRLPSGGKEIFARSGAQVVVDWRA